MSPTSRLRLALLGLILLTVLAYLNSFLGTWQFDDHAVLLADFRVQSLTAWWQSFPHLRPVFKLSVAMQHQVGAKLFGFHLFNLTLHLANTLLLFVFFQVLLGRYLRYPTQSALLISAVFALHPAQTEVVTYLSGRSVALEAFGLLLALNVWQRWLMGSRRVALFGLLLALMIALGSRESAVIAPLWMAWLWCEYRGTSPRVFVLSLAGISALLVMVLLLPRYRELLWLAFQWGSVDELLAVQTQSIVHLLAVAVGWSPLAADPDFSSAPLASGRGVSCAVMVMTFLVVAWWQRRHYALLWLAVCWLVLCWLPTHSIFVRFDPVNDRQLYLALPGIALLMICPLNKVVNAILQSLNMATPMRAAVLAGLVAALLFGLATATHARNSVYQSEVDFWQDVVKKSSANARGWNNLGVAYRDSGEVIAAEKAFEQALVLRPDYQRAAVNLRLLRRNQISP